MMENMEAWQVFQALSVDSMGISLSGIKTVFEVFGVEDEAEIFIKIKTILEGVNSKT